MTENDRRDFPLIAAPFTPMDEDGEVDLDIIEQQAERLTRDGVAGAFVCGTTGEGLSLSGEERRQVAEKWREVILPGQGFRLIISVSHLSLPEAFGLARHASALGADGIAALAPCFYRPQDTEDLLAFCSSVAAAAPTTPFFYYHLPALTGVNFPVADFLENAIEDIPTLAGVKFTHDNIEDFQNCVTRFGDRLELLWGRDQMLLSGVQAGAHGAVGSTYNFAAPLYQRLLRAFADGNEAGVGQEQGIVTALAELLSGLGGLRASKYVMDYCGVPCGPVRLPLAQLTEEEEEQIDARLTTLGFTQG